MKKYTAFKEEEVTPLEGGTWLLTLSQKLGNFFCHFVEGGPGILNGYRMPEYSASEKPKIEKVDTKNAGKIIKKVNKKKFYKDLDAAVIESGHTNKKISQLIDDWYKSSTNEKTSKILFQTLAPVYKSMREKGYASHDLLT